MNKKILVSDYDQTFYLNDEDLKHNIIAVEEFRKKGNIFVFATGRSFYDFHRKIDKYNIPYDYAILNHGATILDKDDNIFANYSIPNEIIKDIKKDLQIDKTIKGFCCSRLESRVDFDHSDLTKIAATYETTEEAMKISKAINEKYSKYINAYYVSKNSVEIISRQTSKSYAISLLLDKIRIDKKNIYTIGDGYSDIDMIKDFNGYAIKDAVEELKKVAIKECSSVWELINEIIHI